MKKTEWMKRASILALLATGATMFQGCTQEEVDAVADTAIIAGAVVVAANSHCVGGYHEICHSYVRYDGLVFSECRQEYDSCLYTELNHFEAAAKSDALAGKAAAAKLGEAVTPVAWANAFAISFDASAKFIGALKEAQTGKIDQMEALGLSRNDLLAIGAEQVPAAASVDALAQHLDASPAAAQAMLAKLVSTMAQVKAAEAQAAAAASAQAATR